MNEIYADRMSKGETMITECCLMFSKKALGRGLSERSRIKSMLEGPPDSRWCL
jgi:hypothetical protein